MDLAERMAVVEGRLDRVERALGLPGRHVASVFQAPPGAVRATSRRGAPVEAARDLFEDPAASTTAPTSHAPPVGTPVERALPEATSATDATDLLAPAGTVGAPLPPLALRPAASPSPAPAPSSTPSPRPPPPTPRAVTRRKPTAPAPGARGDMERYVGVTILGRVGIAAVLLAAGYFAQLAYASFPPALRVASIYALAGLLIGVGALVRSRVAPRYVAILWGGGVAAAYMAGVVARMRYALFTPEVALFALVGACAVGQVLAKSLRQRTLALVALAGAIAAPVLVSSGTDSRTGLLVYLLTLHAWAWFIERRYGATGARLLAVIGVAIVAVLWFAAHGRGDVSTWTHLHLYLFGLTFPEWGSLLRGRGIGPRAAKLMPIVAGAAELILFGLLAAMDSVDRTDPYLIHRFLLFAGLAWAVPPVVGRLRAGAAKPGSAEVTHLAGACLAVGLFFWAGDPSWPGPMGFEIVLGTSAAFAVLSIWARPRLGAGEPAAVLASGLSLLLLTSIAPLDPTRLFAFVGPVALLLLATDSRARVAGLAIGVAAAFVGIAQDASPWRPVACVAIATAVAGIASLRARRLRDEVLSSFADLALVGLVGFWVWATRETGALWGALQDVSLAFLNPGTVTAAVLAVAISLRLRAEPVASATSVGGDPILRVVLGALLVAAGGREVHAALRHVGALDLRAALGALYLAATGPIFFLAAARRRDALLSFEGIIALGIGIALAATHGRIPGRAWVSGIEVAGLVAAVGAGVWLLRSAQAAVRVGLGVLALGIAGAWIAHVTGGRFDVGLQLVNARTLVAALAVALLVFLRGRTREPALQVPSVALGLAAAGLAFGAGLVEVLQAVKDMPSGPIQSVLVSVYATGFSAVLLFVGFRSRSLEVRWLALAGFAVVVLKVGLHDLASVETPWRILVTGCLGVVLLGAAYAYARRDRGAAPLPGDEDPAPSDDTAPPPSPSTDSGPTAPPPPSS